ncbi:uncharacterized protein LOC110700115 [Chenopodium quinoa]|uniref:uncharacterized protein LOC110700115 n=1 Tax=Chenopodium quinoa TaxID=63459 RepID=UPI000B7986E1|nr:uncharacterized protein LOC110700115 [Chenopodium quinoa]
MGYYWPSMRKDAAEFAKKCLAYQKHAPLTHRPSEELHPTLTPWPFMKWGMDIVKLPPSSGQRVYFLATTDYFSKWIEAEAYKEIKDKARHLIHQKKHPKLIWSASRDHYRQRVSVHQQQDHEVL